MCPCLFSRGALVLLLWCMKIVAWNCNNTTADWRLQEIENNLLQGVDVAILIATRERAREIDEGLPRKFRLRHHWGVSWGYGRGWGTNSATGITIILSDSKFKPGQITQLFDVASGDEGLRGRAAGLRIKAGHFDFTFCGLYYPVRPSAQRDRAHYGKVCNGLNKWLRQTLLGMPSRTMPVIAMDLNDSLGLERIDGQICPHGNEAVGTYGKAALQGEAATAVRSLMAEHFMMAANTFDYKAGNGNTYQGARGDGTRIDYVWIPQAARPMVVDVALARRAAKRLTPFRARQLLDHIPIRMVLKYTGVNMANAFPHDGWDPDLMAKCMTEGKHRENFVEDVELAVAGIDATHDAAPDVKLAVLHSHVLTHGPCGAWFVNSC